MNQQITAQDCVTVVNDRGVSQGKRVGYVVEKHFGTEADILFGECVEQKRSQEKGWKEKYRDASEKFKEITGFGADAIFQAEVMLCLEKGLPQPVWGEEARRKMEMELKTIPNIER